MATTLVSIEPARELLADYRADEATAKGAQAGGVLTTRYHGRVITLSIHDLVPSGGLKAARWQQVASTSRKGWSTVLETALPPPAWTSRAARRTTRLKPGWTDAHVERAVDRLMRWATSEINRYEYVDVVWRAEQRIEKTDAFLDAIQAEEQRLGRQSSYDAMTIEDAEHWDKWLGAWVYKVRRPR